MARFNVSLLGDKALEETLKTLTDKMERRVLQKALNRTAKTLRVQVAGNSPARLGRLRASLRVKNMKRRKHRVGSFVLTGTRAALGIPASATGFYPFAQEAGWVPRRPRVRQSEARGSRVAGRRFFRDPLRHAGLLGTLRQEITQGIERELLKAGGSSNAGD